MQELLSSGAKPGVRLLERLLACLRLQPLPGRPSLSNGYGAPLKVRALPWRLGSILDSWDQVHWQRVQCSSLRFGNLETVITRRAACHPNAIPRSRDGAALLLQNGGHVLACTFTARLIVEH